MSEFLLKPGTVFLGLLPNLFSISLEKFLKRRIEYYKIWFAIGAVLSIYFFSQMQFIEYNAVFLILGIFGFWVVLFLSIREYAKRRKVGKIISLLSFENLLIILAHMLDASSTFVALNYYNYFEQHFLPRFFIDIFGPVAMFALKLPVILLALYYIDKEMPDNQKRTFLKIVILILGLAPGLRDLLRLGMLV